ncbi:MAG: hypothetical protein RMI79_03750 [Nitrososphaerota archaeon]|nr:hypothetical protein [Nitrososphaerota archaeon]
MSPDGAQVGLYQEFICPYCGRRITLIITFHQLKHRRIKSIGLINNVLADSEFSKFENLDTFEKIIFSIGKFFDQKMDWPSEKELAKFIGFTIQTVGKYLKELKVKGYVMENQQKRDIHGQFKGKQFSLTEKGRHEYSKITYKISENYFDERKI